MQRDVVLRWLEQLSAMIDKLLRRDPTADRILIEQQLADAEGQLVGPVRTLVERLSPESAAELLTDPFRIHGYAQLVAFRSAIARSQGQLAEADELARRALALGREAVTRADPVPSDWIEWVGRLEGEIGPAVD